jgi:phosphoesterase RecJ-like protein
VIEPDALGGLGLVRTTVDAESRRALGLPLDAVERVIDTLRAAGEAEVALVLKQDDAGRWRVSTRSKGCLDVGRASRGLGGGGHRFAAGATLDGSAEAVLADVRAALAASLEAG